MITSRLCYNMCQVMDNLQKQPANRVLPQALCISGLLLLSAVGWAQLKPPASQQPPTPILPSPNAYDFYHEAVNMHLALIAANPASQNVDPLTDRRPGLNFSKAELRKRYPRAAKLAWLRKNQSVLAHLRKGFAYPYLQPAQRPPVVPDKYMGGIRQLARLLIIESRLKSERGDWKGASKSAMDVLEMGADIARGGGYMSALFSYAVTAIGTRELNDIVPHLDAATARSLALKMETMELNRHPFAANMAEEKWIGLVSLDQFLKTYKAPGALLALPNQKGPFSGKQFLGNMTRSGIVRNYATFLDDLTLQMRLPYLRRKFPPSPYQGTTLEILTSPYTSTRRRLDWNSARNDTAIMQLRLRLALHSWQIKHGTYPVALKALMPNYARRIPADPFGAGEPMRYRKTPNGYLLYSIGPDGKDDGGKPVYSPKKTSKTNPRAPYLVDTDSRNDFVAGVNR